MPQPQQETEQIPGNELTVAVGSSSPKLKTIDCTVDTEQQADWETLKSNEQQIRAALFGKGFRPLIFPDQPDISFLSEIQDFSLPEEGGKLYSEGSMQILTFPYALDAAQTSFVISGGDSAKSYYYDNNGDTDVYPVYTVTFTANVFEFTLMCGSNSLGFGAMLVTDTLIIDTVKERVFKNGVDATYLMDGTNKFPIIPVGSQEIVAYGKPVDYPLSTTNWAIVNVVLRRRYI